MEKFELTEYFSPTTSSIELFFLAQNGSTGLVIPVYQRPYSWPNDKIKKLISDISHGYVSAFQNPETATYLGAVIAVNQSGKELFGTKQTLPAVILSVIDGQQRLTTLLLIIAALHERLSILQKKFQFDKDNDGSVQLAVMTKKIISTLHKVLIMKQDYVGDEDNPPCFPRIIRAYMDRWEISGDTYVSPIASFLYQYNEFLTSAHYREAKKESDLTFNLDCLKAGDDPEDQANLKLLKKSFSDIRQHLKKLEISTEPSEENEIETPAMDELIHNSPTQERLFKDKLNESLKVILKTEDKNGQVARKLVRYIGFAAYLTQRVAITKVETKVDDYAFEIFEALNASGEPLTAIETFKPKVFEGKNEKELKNTAGYIQLKKIEEYLSAETTKDKNSRTNDILIAFALGMKGEQLAKRLNDQRNFLKIYERLSSEALKEDFVRSLYLMTQFFKKVWVDPADIQQVFTKLNTSEINELKVCLYFLNNLKHTVTIGTLFHFYLSVMEPEQNDIQQAAAEKEFLEAVKACVAYSTLWRGAFGSTKGIDTFYRSICKTGYSDDNGAQILPPLSRLTSNNTIQSYATAAALKKAFLRKLQASQILEKSAWVNHAKTSVNYGKNIVVSKLLSLMAAKDTQIDSFGNLVRGKSGITPVLDPQFWNESSVEHIAPQTPSSDWKKDKYSKFYGVENECREHGLGNLTLLPATLNSALQNRSWEDKKLVYTALAEKDPEKAEKLIAPLKLSEEAHLSICSRKRYYVLAESIAGQNYPDWLPDLVDGRTQLLLGLSYDNLIDWLN